VLDLEVYRPEYKENLLREIDEMRYLLVTLHKQIPDSIPQKVFQDKFEEHRFQLAKWTEHIVYDYKRYNRADDL